MTGLWRWLALAAMPMTLAAQKDFLTTNEVEKIRDAQDPNERMEAYASFARERIELIRSLVARDKQGRAVVIHDTLDAYSKIIDAMDDVSDDALERHADVRKGVEALERVETASLVELKRLRDSHPKDLERYEFVLTDAIDTTQDSLDTAHEGLDERMRRVQERQEQEAAEKKSEMAPADGSAPAQSNQSNSQQDTQRKAPTLLRPGERPPNQ